MTVTAATMRILEPAPGVFAYYDGRIPGARLHSAAPNWLDDGAYVLGTASYALVEGTEALVYDTHMSLAHARFIRDDLEARGVRTMRVVLSHWHNDHVAGNAVFADGEIIALAATARLLEKNRGELATRPPPIHPLVMPNRLFEDRLDVMVGPRRVELHHFAIHSADGNVLWLPDTGMLLAGDTLEDTVTYIAEAEAVGTHLQELDRLRRLPVRRILPNHGDPRRIADGGYDASLIDATEDYVRQLTRLAESDPGHDAPLDDVIARALASGALTAFAPYEAVHRRNLAAMRAVARPGGRPVTP